MLIRPYDDARGRRSHRINAPRTPGAGRARIAQLARVAGFEPTIAVLETAALDRAKLHRRKQKRQGGDRLIIPVLNLPHGHPSPEEEKRQGMGIAHGMPRPSRWHLAVDGQ